MIKKKLTLHLSVLLLSILIFNVHISVSLAQEQDSASGELKIQSINIEKLVLQDQNGKQKTINDPEQVITLPVGEYSIKQVHLKGGYSCGYRTTMNLSDSISIDSNKQIKLKAGDPLKQIIHINRQGKYLVLSYELLGVDNQKYMNSNREKQPEFSIYKADKLIASGNFEFG